MIMKLARSPDEARTAMDALLAVRTALAKGGRVRSFNDRLCTMFVKVSVKCVDVPSTRVGAAFVISYQCPHLHVWDPDMYRCAPAAMPGRFCHMYRP